MDYKRFTTPLALFILAGLVNYVTGVPTPRFLSREQNITGNSGDTVVIQCNIIGLIASQTVQWHFLDHSTQISENMHILIDGGNRYSILRPQGDGEGMWNLEIRNLRHEDQGSYSCEISMEHSKLEQINHVTVSDAPLIPKPPLAEIPHVNFTECCLIEGVSAPCLPACSPSTLDLNTFNPSEACTADLIKLLRCGSDERNHVPCCRERYVPSMCFGFCVNKPPAVLGTHLNTCLEQSAKIVSCFEEGQHLLPTAPVFFKGEAISSSQIFLKWRPPAENPETVTGYKVFYQIDGETGFRSISTLIQASDLYYSLGQLQASTKYNVYVIAINSHGASQPSYLIEVITKSSTPMTPGADEEALTKCCERRGVHGMCQDFLCKGYAPTASQEEKLNCYVHIDQVLTCISGETNHTDCCMRMAVPGKCYKLCSGQVTNLDYEQMECFSYMSRIGSCFVEGRDTVPGSPYLLHMRLVSDSKAIVEWYPPQKNAYLLQEYLVRYKERSAQTYTEMTVRGTQATLTGLKPGTLYQTQVVAVGAQGSSLPSTSAVFLTYPTDVSVPSTTTTPPPPHDPKKCCEESNVPELCQQFCSYDLNTAAIDTGVLLSCEQELGHIFKCGADGRNHTACCQREDVPDICLPFCSFDEKRAAEYTFSWEQLECLQTVNSVINCLQEGLGTLPSYPREVQVVTVTTHTVSLTWREPLRIPDGTPALLYDVQYRIPAQDQISWSDTKTADTHVIVQNLAPDTEYEIRVVAYTHAGNSVPTELLVVRTKATEQHINVSAPADLTECCQKKNVSQACMPACSGTGLINLHQCSADMGKLIQCSSDGRDHKKCCQRSSVPEHCMGFCDGTGEVTDFTSLLCLSVSQQIFSCFREGYAKLPSMPVNFHVYEIGTHYVELRWSPPEANADGVEYDLYIQGMYEDAFYTKEGVISPLNKDGLRPFTMYTFYLLARNQYGSSPPSPTYKVWTLRDAVPELKITQEPSNPVSVNDKVTLKCVGYGQPTPTVFWSRGMVKTSTSQTYAVYTIDSVQKEDVGRYTCVANSTSGRSVKDQYIKVQYAVVVTPLARIVKVEPYKGLTAHLQCDFRGFPDKIEWLKNGNVIHQGQDDSNRFMWARHVRQDEGVIESHLSILAVTAQDFDHYTCSGENSLGHSQEVIKLIDPSLVPGMTPPSVQPAPRVTNVTACCIKKSVQPSCLSVCTFDVDIDQLVSSPHCLPDAAKLIQCAADGSNHTQCCQKESVPAHCLGFCGGVTPTDINEEYFDCILHVHSILTCMEQGHDNIPGPPRNVHASVAEGGIQVWWDSPAKNPDKIQYYDVHYTPSTDVFTVAHNTQRVTLKSIRSHEMYSIYVIARNHHGSSQKSKTVKVKTDDMYPSEPRKLMGEVMDGTSVHLVWDPPLVDHGFVLNFNVYYAHVGSTDFKKVATVHDTDSYLLEGLEPKTRYSIYLTSVGSHHESKKSNVITVETEEAKPRAVPHKAGNSKEVGVGLGVFFGLIIMAAVVGGFVFWYLRTRKGLLHNRFKDSVAFENPGYSTTREAQVVSGLPGEPSLGMHEQQPANGGPPSSSLESSIMKEVAVPAVTRAILPSVIQHRLMVRLAKNTPTPR